MSISGNRLSPALALSEVVLSEAITEPRAEETAKAQSAQRRTEAKGIKCRG
jgi:hypothetical protein